VDADAPEVASEPVVPVDPQAKWARRIVSWLANLSFVLAIILDLWWFETWLWRGVMFVPMLAFTFFVLFGMGYIPVRLFVHYRKRKAKLRSR